MNKVINYCHDCLEFDAAIDGYTCAAVDVAVQRYSLDKIDIDTDSMIVGAIAYDTVGVVVAVDGVDVAFVCAAAAAVAADGVAAAHSGGMGAVSMVVAHFAVSHASHASHCSLYGFSFHSNSFNTPKTIETYRQGRKIKINEHLSICYNLNFVRFFYFVLKNAPSLHKKPKQIKLKRWIIWITCADFHSRRT